MNEIFVTSDNHFFHANFIHKYKIRDFSSVEEMNELMIENHNKVVGKGDLVYNLGDFSFGGVEETRAVIKRLNGDIFYVRGNHEDNLKGFADLFVWVKDRYDLKIPFDGEGSHNGKMTIVLDHYAKRVWNKSHRGSWHLYGHSHCDLYDDPNSLSFDVGVDCHNFTPWHISEVIAKMKTKNVYGAGFDKMKLIETNKCPLCDNVLGKSWNPDALWCESCKRVFE
jgi:calcineurin-like phosphoesterase family protein